MKRIGYSIFRVATAGTGCALVTYTIYGLLVSPKIPNFDWTVAALSAIFVLSLLGSLAAMIWNAYLEHCNASETKES